MTFTIPMHWFQFALGVLAGWASLLALGVWLKRRGGSDE